MKKTLLFAAEFEKFITVSAGGRRVLPSGKRLSPGTSEQYRMVCRLLREYEQRIGCSVRIALLHRCSMQIIRQEKNYWKRFFKRFADFLYSGKGYFDQYVGFVFKVLKESLYNKCIQANLCLTLFFSFPL